MPAQTFAKIPLHDLYIFQGELPGPIEIDQQQAEANSGQPKLRSSFALSEPAPVRKARGVAGLSRAGLRRQSLRDVPWCGQAGGRIARQRNSAMTSSGEVIDLFSVTDGSALAAVETKGAEGPRLVGHCPYNCRFAAHSDASIVGNPTGSRAPIFMTIGI